MVIFAPLEGKISSLLQRAAREKYITLQTGFENGKWYRFYEKKIFFIGFI